MSPLTVGGDDGEDGTTMSTTTTLIRCDRCRRRLRNTAEAWNATFIAGLVVGYLCPTCQTTAEDLEAELNAITNDYAVVSPGASSSGEDLIEQVVRGLVSTYPTPEVMRSKAGALLAARNDLQASEMARLMGMVADDMESGALWEASAS